MTDKDFIEAGYTQWKPSPYNGECNTAMFQKRFDDDFGKKYFITANKWDFSRYEPDREPSYEFTSQVYDKSTHDAIDITFLVGWTIERVEKWMDDHWSADEYDYYEKFYEDE